jgi:hypothetical protein
METPRKNDAPGVIVASTALWILFVGHIFSGLFLRNLGAGLSQIDDPTTARIAENLSGAFHFFVHYAPPPMIALVVILQILIILKKPAQWGIDLIGALLTLRCLIQFLILNLLLLSHLKAGGDASSPVGAVHPGDHPQFRMALLAHGFGGSCQGASSDPLLRGDGGTGSL